MSSGIRNLFFFLPTILLLSGLTTSCFYYTEDLRHGSRGSVAGGVAAGLIALETTTSVPTLGGSIILGSVLGNIFGSVIDSESEFHLEDPTTGPIPMFYYKTYRAMLVPERFFPGEILIEQHGQGMPVRYSPMIGQSVNYG
jgi:uncharacterized protein (DUF2062 family)